MSTKIFWFCIYFLKNLVVAVMVAGIVAVVFPPAGAILGALLLFGVFSTSWKDAGKKMESIALGRLIKESEFEIEGFDQALRQTLRSMR